MAQFKMWIFCLLSLTYLHARGEENTPCVGDVEEYLDEVLEKVKKDMPDPLPLPSREGETEKDATLTEGVAWGIDTLHRTGPAVVTCDASGVTIKAQLGVEEMSGRYKWEKFIKSVFSSRRRSGFAFMKAEEFELEVVVSQERAEGAKAVLESLKVTKMEGIDVEVTGVTYVTWIASHLLDPVANFFKEGVAAFVEKKLFEATDRVLPTMRIPLLPLS